MTCQTVSCWWAWCPCCGRERRLVRNNRVMRTHNRWDPVIRAMVACEGSGHPPRLNGHSQADSHSLAQRAGDGAAAKRCEAAR